MIGKNWEKIDILNEQLLNTDMDTLMRLDKMDVLRHLYDIEGANEEACHVAKEAIVLGTSTLHRELSPLQRDRVLEIVKNGYFNRGRFFFDDYMIAMEWNRAKNARFWLPRRKILEGKHHVCSQIQAFLDDPEAKFLSISMPPGTGKSTLIKFLMAFISGRAPYTANMYVSYSDGMVRMMLESLRDMLTSDEYCHNDIFTGNPAPAVSAEYNTISYRNKGDFPTFSLVSVGGSVTGRTRANNFLITDDLVKNDEEAKSPDRLDKLFRQYMSTLTTRMIGDNVKQIMLGTIWSINDPISRMIADHEDDPAYKFIQIPIYDEETYTSNFDYDHPDRYDMPAVERLMSQLTPAEFSCLCMQRPMEHEGLAFPPEQMRWYNGVLPDGEPDAVSFATDVAWGGTDYLSMPIIYEYGDDMYVHDAVFDNRDKLVTKPRVVGKILQHQARLGQFEANNGGDEYADDISSELRKLGYSCNITSKTSTSARSKLVRIEQHAPVIKQMYFRKDEARGEEYMRFMRNVTGFSFTAKNKNDDAPDSLALWCDFRRNGRPNIAKIFKRNGRL